MRRIMLPVLFATLTALAGAARAAEPPQGAPAPPATAAPPAANPLGGVAVTKYHYDPAEPGAGAQTGARFLEDLKALDPALWAAVRDGVRYQIQDEEQKKFVHQRKFVIAAYAVLWAILIVFVVGMWQRQRKLSADLAQLDARLRAGDAK